MAAKAVVRLDNNTRTADGVRTTENSQRVSKHFIGAKQTYDTKLVDTTPTATAMFTMIRGSVIMVARASAGMYSERMTPSQGRYKPTTNSYIKKAPRDKEKELGLSTGSRQGVKSRIAQIM